VDLLVDEAKNILLPVYAKEKLNAAEKAELKTLAEQLANKLSNLERLIRLLPVIKVSKKFDALDIARRINQLVRAQSNKLSQLEVALDLFLSHLNEYRLLAGLSLAFAILVDAAALGAGIGQFPLQCRR